MTTDNVAVERADYLRELIYKFLQEDVEPEGRDPQTIRKKLMAMVDRIEESDMDGDPEWGVEREVLRYRRPPGMSSVLIPPVRSSLIARARRLM